jgi:hypothetical protein
MSDFPTPIQPDPEGAAVAPVPALRSALVDAIRRRRRRLRMRAAIAGGACVVVAVALLGGGVFTSGPERVLAIDDNGGEWVKIRILDGEAGAAEMTRELQEGGIDGEVRLLPAIPQAVGHWMGISLGQEKQRGCSLPEGGSDDPICHANPPLLLGDDVNFGGDRFEIRRDAIYLLGVTRTIFYVGREPEPGETPLDSPPRGVDLGFAYPAVVPPGERARPIEP